MLYENAAKKCPDSIEIAAELFFCFVVDNDFDKQKLVAMKMFKNGHAAFGTWAATVSSVHTSTNSTQHCAVACGV